MKNRFLYLTMLCIASFSFVNAQQLNHTEPLPFDPDIRKGVLPNGMTYYLHSTDVTKDVASYYIIQNVGSVLENDDQQGLAHFLEHMAFNGTEAFEGKGILNTFQKHGLIFGRDINAYTSFDETVYNIDNIPTTPELIETGLQVLHDWSNYLLLTEEEIDAERGVIKEEWRTRQSGSMRILQKNIGAMFNHSIYSKRLPIGLIPIIENFEYKALRDFYHDWYRTDLQAIAIVGDIDVEAMEAKIKAKFSKIPAVENPKPRAIAKIADNKELVYSMAMDKEVSTASISFGMRHNESLENETIGDMRLALVDGMIGSMFGARLREASLNPDASFLGVSVGNQAWARAYKTFNVRVAPKPKMQLAAFKEALVEVNRAVKFGFTPSEINRTIVNFTSSYENQIKQVKERSHRAIINGIQENYLNNSALMSAAQEYAFAKVLFTQISAAEIHNRLKELYTATNRVITVTGVEGNENLTEELAKKIIAEVEGSTEIQPYEDDFEGKSLLGDLKIEKGSIVNATENKAIGSTTFTLSNGVKVHYMYSDKNEDNVKLVAVSDGGKSLIKDEDIPSLDLMGNLAMMSGIGEYSATELQKVMAGKTAKANISVGELTEQISGSSVSKDVETMLQLVHLRFEKPRFEAQAFQVLQGGIKNYLIRRTQDLRERMRDSVTVALYGKNHPKKRIFNAQYVSEISFDKIKDVYADRFRNPGDFEFFIVGDVSSEELQPLLAKYIASLPTSEDKEKWVDNSVKWIKPTIDKDVFIEMEDPKSTVYVTLKNDMEYNLKNYFLMKVVGDILQLRYTETLREDEGGTYGAGTYARLKKKPKGEGVIQVNFDCNPEKVEDLIVIVNKEIEKLKSGEILQEDLDKTLTNYAKDREEQKNYNSYEMSLMRNYFLEGYNMNNPENFDNIIKNITIKDIQKLMHTFSENAATSEVVFKPKK